MSCLAQFSKLIINELYKAFFQKKTIVFISFIAFSIVVLAIINHAGDPGNKWKGETEKQITNLKKTISQIESDKSKSQADQDILKFSKEQLTILEYRLEHSLPENVPTPYRFLYNAGNIVAIIVLFMTIFSSNIISNEYSSGAIRQLLVKPVKRWKIYLAKYISSVLVSTILCMILLAMSLVIGLIMFSKNSASINEVVLSNGSLVERNMLNYGILNLLAELFSIYIIITLSFLISTIVRTSSLSVIITLVVYFGSVIGGSFLTSAPFYKYLLTPNLSLSQYLPGNELPFKGGTVWFSLIICVTYAGLLLAGGLLIFQKRDVY